MKLDQAATAMGDSGSLAGPQAPHITPHSAPPGITTGDSPATPAAILTGGSLRRRIFTASLANETQTAAPFPLDRRAFEQALYFPPGMHPATATLSTAPIVAARRLAAAGHCVIEGTSAWAEPAGPLGRAAYESLRNEILDQLEAAMPVDIILLGLHGGMVAGGYDDCEGDILTLARAIAPQAVIGAELDLHAHLTPAMVAAADVIVAFKEFPHTDFLARAHDLARLCLATADGAIHPVPAVYDLRQIGGYTTAAEPGRSFTDRLLAQESVDGILSISIIHGSRTADVHDVGTKVLVYADAERTTPSLAATQAAALAERLGQEILGWSPPDAPTYLSPEAAIARALAEPSQPVIIADRWQNPAGIAGDSTVLLRALLDRPDVPAAIALLWDPVAVQLCTAAGAGAHLHLRFCGKATPESGQPVDAHVFVRSVTEDLVIRTGRGMMSLGQAACISIGSLDIVLGSTRGDTFPPGAFTRMGVTLSAKKIVAVKGSEHCRAAYAPVAASFVYVDTTGSARPEPADMHYTKIRRPIAPLDPGSHARLMG